MINLDKLIDTILDYLNDIPLTERFHYRIVLREDLRSLFTRDQIRLFHGFAYTETHRSVFYSPYVTDDIIIINNKVRPIKNMKVLQIKDFINH